MKPQIAPSLLSADFVHMEHELEWFNNSSAELLHYDVMDGVFVPNFSFGWTVLQSIAPALKKPVDVHLMCMRPEKWIPVLKDLPVRYMTVHQEVVYHLHRMVDQIHEAGLQAGVALNPATPISTLEEILPMLDLVLIMTVDPGFGGQKFIESTVDKVRRMRKMIDESGSHALIEVDGGVTLQTAPRLIEAGVDILVSGSGVFKAKDPIAMVDAIRNCCENK